MPKIDEKTAQAYDALRAAAVAGKTIQFNYQGKWLDFVNSKTNKFSMVDKNGRWNSFPDEMPLFIAPLEFYRIKP